MTFMWTFDGVMQAIALGLSILILLFFGLMCLIENIKDRLNKKGK